MNRAVKRALDSASPLGIMNHPLRFSRVSGRDEVLLFMRDEVDLGLDW